MVLGHNGEWWDVCVLISLGFAFLVALAVAISTTGSVFAHKRESEASKYELDAFKTETAGKVADASKAGIEAGELAGHAQAAIDAANVEIAKANVRAAEAELETQRLKEKLAPRFPGPKFEAALNGQPTGTVEIVYLKDAPDTLAYGGWVLPRLAMHGWKIKDFRAIIPDPNDPSSNLSALLGAHGSLSGVTIVANLKNNEVGMAQFNGLVPPTTMLAINKYSPALGALVKAFADNDNEVALGRPDPSLPDETFRIVVGPKS